MLYEIAITMIDGVGPRYAKNIIAHCGSAKNFFQEKSKHIQKIPSIGPFLVKKLQEGNLLERAEEEMRFIEKNGIKVLYFENPEYPSKLKHCDDCPIVIYSKGNTDFGHNRVVSIVGTRMASSYGLDACSGIVSDLAIYQPVIVSGLALGIDSMAHRAALENRLQTWAAVGHSLDRIYPHSNRDMAIEIMNQGAIMSEYSSGTKPDRENFPMRNRLVAGMADVTIVIETGIKGGSMITAELASGYFRDVFAVPGRITDNSFFGCHKLIQENRAIIFTSVDQLAQEMGWETKKNSNSSNQAALFIDLSVFEQQIVDFIKKSGEASIDDIALNLKTPVSKINSELLSMELKGITRALPGKRFTV